LVRAFCEENDADVEEIRGRHRLDWSTIRSLAADPLVEIGSHSVTHVRFCDLDDASALAEFRDSRRRLEEMLGRPIRHFAFPFGRSVDCGPRDFALAREAGYVTASTTVKGLVHPNVDRYALPRNTLNGNHRRLVYPWLHMMGIGGWFAKLTGQR
jgi:peptidoglycan/xylan/chitin deacetylase (PgdA/CDA1 family)